MGPAGPDWVRLGPTGSRRSNSRRGEIEGAKGEGATEEEAISLFFATLLRLPCPFLAPSWHFPCPFIPLLSPSLPKGQGRGKDRRRKYRRGKERWGNLPLLCSFFAPSLLLPFFFFAGSAQNAPSLPLLSLHPLPLPLLSLPPFAQGAKKDQRRTNKGQRRGKEGAKKGQRRS